MKLTFLLIVTFFTNFIYALEINESLRLDGYSNVTGNTGNKKDTDSFKINGGFQGRYQVSQDISITGHIYFEEEKNSNNIEDYEEDIKWFYADYYIGNEITLRAGKFQFPIFTSAEVGSIGYLRTWVENPISSYGAFGYDDFIGAEILKNFSYDNYDFLLQLSYGRSENNLPAIDKSGNTITGEADSIGGVTLKTSNDWLMLNLGYIRALSSINDSNSQDSNKSNLNVNFNMYALETQVDVDKFSLKIGLITADLSSIFPDEQRYYTSMEYNYNDFTPYIYYANEKLNFKEKESNNLKNTKVYESQNYSIGVRYDFSKNTAFKLSYLKHFDTTKYTDNSVDKDEEEAFKGSINVLF